MTAGDYVRTLFIVLMGGIALCLVLMGALLAFYGVRRITRKERKEVHARR